MKSFKHIIIFSFFLLLCPVLFAQTHNWTRTNPGGGGAFNCVKAGPTGIIVAGSDLSGAYMSKDKGASFTCIGAPQGIPSTHVIGVGFDPVDPDKFFIGTISSLHRTTDGGLTFSKVISSGDFSDIVVCKSNPQYVYAAGHSSYKSVDGAIYLSTDGGSTFSNVSGNTGKRILKLISDPTNSSIIYYVSGKARDGATACIARLYRSTDGGVTFTDITGGLGEVMDADIDPVTTSTIYMTTYTSFPGGNFYKSTNSGATWSAPIAHPGGIFVKRDEPNRVRVIEPRAPASWNSGSGTWESTNGGSTFTKTGDITKGWDTGYNKSICTTSDFYDVFKTYNGTGFEGVTRGFGTDMSDPNVILWCNNQFLFRSGDGGVTFKNIVTHAVSPDLWQSTGIDNVDMTDMAISEVNPNIVYAGFFDIGFWRSLDGGKSWQSSNYLPYTGNWNGYGGNVMSIIADPTREKVVWTTMSGDQEGASPTVLLKSIKSGERGSWVLSNTGMPTVEVMGLSLDRSSTSTSRTMYVTAQGYLYKSTNDGANWTKITNGLPTDGGIRFTAVDNFDGNVVYAGGGRGLYASIDGGISWTLVGNSEINRNGSLAFWGYGNGLGVFDIVPDPQTSGTVYVAVYGVGKGLYRGVKGTGATWTWTKLCTDNFMRKVSVNPSNNNYVYAASSSAFTDGSYDINSHGVYFSNDKFASYSLVNDGMTWPFAVTVKCDKLNNVYVGSPGTGFQKAQIPGLPVAGINEIKNQKEIIDFYPNPVTDFLNIANDPAYGGKFNINIYNLLGKCVLTSSKSETRIDVSELPAGIYSVSLIGQDFNYSGKFIKR